eukprot:14831-Eustigmatos_ZCMA.PRE.1
MSVWLPFASPSVSTRACRILCLIRGQCGGVLLRGGDGQEPRGASGVRGGAAQLLPAAAGPATRLH